MGDEDLARRVREDCVDILVDLAGHTTQNRVLVFARKPAPVQITYLGFPGSTGLEAMDYRLTDHFVDPEGSAIQYYSEQLLRLPHSLWCFHPPPAMPKIGRSPALTNGFITFGSFNSINKVDGRTLALWSRLLCILPNSKLLMATVPEGKTRDNLRAHFARLGVSENRIEFLARLDGEKFLEMLSRVDINLDPVSVNGATTTCESLWLGVPVLNLVGNRFLERAGLSILTAAGIPEFAVDSEERYIGLALELSKNLEMLAVLRANLDRKSTRLNSSHT